MPYFISNEHPDCGGWAVVKEDFTLLGCHTSRERAVAQMVAVSISENVEPGGDWENKDKYRS